MTVDDHPLLRQGIATLIEAETDMELVAEACDGEEAIAQFRLHRPDVTLMDLQMPNVNGTEAISQIRSEFPDAKNLWGDHAVMFKSYTRSRRVHGGTC